MNQRVSLCILYLREEIGPGLVSKTQTRVFIQPSLGKIIKLSEGKFKTNFVLFPSGFPSERGELCKEMISVSIVW